jgi:hypothetical protein
MQMIGKIILLTPILLSLPFSAFAQQQCDRLHFLEVDSDKTYRPGQQIKYDEAHGVYTGLMSVDTMYFMCPIKKTVKKSGSLAPGEIYEDGSVSVFVRKATDRSWSMKILNYRCEDLSLKSGKMEYAVFNGEEIEVGSHNALCLFPKASFTPPK